MEPLDAIPLALTALSVSAWSCIIFACFKHGQSPPIQLPVTEDNDYSSVSSSSTRVDALQDADIPVDIDNWARRVNRRKLAFIMSAFAAVACNLTSISIEGGAGWRAKFWLAYWINVGLLGFVWRMGTSKSWHWLATIFLAAICSVTVAETLASMLLKPSATMRAALFHDFLPLIWNSLCLIMAISIERAPPCAARSPYTYPAGTEEERVLASGSASIASMMTFDWLCPILQNANQGGDESKYPKLPAADRSFALHNKWKSSCRASIRSVKPVDILPGDMDMGRPPLPKLFNRLQWRILVCNTATILRGTVLEMVLACLRYAPAWTVKNFLETFEKTASGRASRRLACAWLIVIVLSMTARSLVQNQAYANWNVINTPAIRSQLNGVLFAKTLRLRDSVHTGNPKQTKQANVMSLFSTDAQRVAEAPNRAVELIICRPIELIISGYLLFTTLGISGFLGVLIPFALTPVTQHFVRKLSRDQGKLMAATDARLSLTNEILQSIKYIKFMAYESISEKRVFAAREHELKRLWAVLYDKIIVDLMGVAGPMLALLLTLIVYTRVEQQVLTASVAFSAILVMEQLRLALANMTAVVFTLVQAKTSLSRLETYLEQYSLDHIDTDVTGESHHLELRTRQAHTRTSSIVLDNASFGWTVSPGDFRLADLNATFGGGLNLVCGPIGAGKTLLLRGLLEEAYLLGGSATMDGVASSSEDHWLDGSTAYSPQTPWLLNGSIRDNVLFGQSLVEPRYSDVLQACGLSPDLAILEDGDMTEVGEKGVILSGGQKARVSLARAIYSRASILLLDDPLSAVDAHTGRHIFENCLCGTLAAGRVILLVSHAVQLCAPNAASVFHLDSGRVAFAGAGKAYMQSPMYTESLAYHNDPEASSDMLADTMDEAVSHEHPTTCASSLTAVAPKASSKRTQVAPLIKTEAKVGEFAYERFKRPIRMNKKTQAASEWIIWSYWFKLSGGPRFAVMIFSAFLAGKALWFARDAWIGIWADHVAASEGSLRGSDSDIWVLTALTSSTIVIMSLRFPIALIGSRRVSRKLYTAMLTAVLRSPMRFFDTISMGPLLNRFGRDIEVIDVDLAAAAGDVLNSVVGYIMVTITIALASPMIALTIVPLLTLAYVYYGKFFMYASREIRKLDAMNKSPLFGLYSETISGLDVIRAYKRTSPYMLAFLQKYDRAQLYYVLTWYANRWLSVRFDMISVSFTAFIGAAILLAPTSIVTPGFAGFALYTTIRASAEIFWLIRHLTSIQMGLTSVERCREYTKLASEAAEVAEWRPPSSWPDKGAIEIDHLAVRYDADLPLVLKDVSVSIAGGEKVGIVGATGSGKSTLSLALFRFMEATEGTVTIDGLDIAKVGLSELRSKLCIVPQDPTVLSGSLRSTLDPLSIGYTDKELYDALKKVHLLRDGTDSPEEGLVSQHQQFFRNLDSHISEQGKNLSAGEKQLVCMARAILKRCKVVICDEATSSLDQQTDRLVTQTLSEGFGDSTMLVIAHRLRTIITFDKVMVMHEGRVAEYDTPSSLLANPNSRFHALCRATGPQEFASLQQLCAADVA